MERILVVEDDRILNMTLSYNLKSAGYEVESVMRRMQRQLPGNTNLHWLCWT